MSDLQSVRESVLSIFQRCGFTTTTNTKIGDITVDLLAEKDIEAVPEDFRVIVDCRKLEQPQEVHDLIFFWKQKRKELSANKIILVILGVRVLGEDKKMAEQDGIIMWEEENVSICEGHVDKDCEDGTKRLLGQLGLESYLDPEYDRKPKSIDY